MKTVYLVFILLCIHATCGAQTRANGTDTANISLYPFDPELPQFPGGHDSLVSFIEQNQRWPNPEVCIEGKVVLRFTIDTTGTIKNIEVIKSLSPAYDNEAIRLVQSMPKWTSRTTIKETKYTLPIKFETKH